MGQKFPVVGYKRVVEFFEKRGYVFHNQRGSHLVFYKDGDKLKPISIPKHREVTVGVILSNLRIAGIGKEEFIKEVAKK